MAEPGMPTPGGKSVGRKTHVTKAVKVATKQYGCVCFPLRGRQPWAPPALAGKHADPAPAAQPDRQPADLGLRRDNPFESEDLNRSATDDRMKSRSCADDIDRPRVQKDGCYAAVAAQQCILESSIVSAGNAEISRRSSSGGDAAASASLPAGGSASAGGAPGSSPGPSAVQPPPEKRLRIPAIAIKRFESK